MWMLLQRAASVSSSCEGCRPLASCTGCEAGSDWVVVTVHVWCAAFKHECLIFIPSLPTCYQFCPSSNRRRNRLRGEMAYPVSSVQSSRAKSGFREWVLFMSLKCQPFKTCTKSLILQYGLLFMSPGNGLGRWLSGYQHLFSQRAQIMFPTPSGGYRHLWLQVQGTRCLLIFEGTRHAYSALTCI